MPVNQDRGCQERLEKSVESLRANARNLAHRLFEDQDERADFNRIVEGFAIECREKARIGIYQKEHAIEILENCQRRLDRADSVDALFISGLIPQSMPLLEVSSQQTVIIGTDNGCEKDKGWKGKVLNGTGAVGGVGLALTGASLCAGTKGIGCYFGGLMIAQGTANVSEAIGITKSNWAKNAWQWGLGEELGLYGYYSLEVVGTVYSATSRTMISSSKHLFKNSAEKLKYYSDFTRSYATKTGVASLINDAVSFGTGIEEDFHNNESRNNEACK